VVTRQLQIETLLDSLESMFSTGVTVVSHSCFNMARIAASVVALAAGSMTNAAAMTFVRTASSYFLSGMAPASGSLRIHAILSSQFLGTRLGISPSCIDPLSQEAFWNHFGASFPPLSITMISAM